MFHEILEIPQFLLICLYVYICYCIDSVYCLHNLFYFLFQYKLNVQYIYKFSIQNPGVNGTAGRLKQNPFTCSEYFDYLRSYLPSTFVGEKNLNVYPSLPYL